MKITGRRFSLEMSVSAILPSISFWLSPLLLLDNFVVGTHLHGEHSSVILKHQQEKQSTCKIHHVRLAWKRWQTSITILLSSFVFFFSRSHLIFCINKKFNEVFSKPKNASYVTNCNLPKLISAQSNHLCFYFFQPIYLFLFVSKMALFMF